MPKKAGNGKPEKKSRRDWATRERERKESIEKLQPVLERLKPGEIQFLNKWLNEGNEWLVDSYAARLGVPVEMRPLFQRLVETRAKKRE